MRIREITAADIRAGTNWRVVDDTALGGDEPLEELVIEPAERFSEDDTVVYSCVCVLDSGPVRPLVMIKRVGDYDYGGDYCELTERGWRQLGLVPDPQAAGQEYVARPLENDPSFASDGEYRRFHAAGFQEWVRRLGLVGRIGP